MKRRRKKLRDDFIYGKKGKSENCPSSAPKKRKGKTR